MAGGTDRRHRACSLPRPSRIYREDLRIPMAAAGPRGLEAMLMRPSGTRRYPLALISHGAPREGSARAADVAVRILSAGPRVRPARLCGAGRSCAEATAIPAADYAENSGPCGQRDYLRAAWQSASDLRAAVEAMQ